MNREDHWTGPVICWIDMLVALMVIFMAQAQIEDPKKAEAKGDIVSPGAIGVQVFWDDDKNYDVDTWIQSPDEDAPIYYASKNGPSFDLLRDDRGITADDTSGRNFENAYSRGVIAGEYTVNVLMFSTKFSGRLPVHVIIQWRDGNGSTSDIADRTVVLDHPKQEITVARFRMDASGKLVKDSVNWLYKPLATGTSKDTGGSGAPTPDRPSEGH